MSYYPRVKEGGCGLIGGKITIGCFHDAVNGLKIPSNLGSN